jgi:hypothetical protein
MQPLLAAAPDFYMSKLINILPFQSPEVNSGETSLPSPSSSYISFGTLASRRHARVNYLEFFSLGLQICRFISEMEDLFALLFTGQYITCIVLAVFMVYSAAFRADLSNSTLNTLYILAAVSLAIFALIRILATSHFGQVFVPYLTVA